MSEQELLAEVEQLKTANQNKADLISISAHELRTSLSAVKWLLKMLVDEDFGKLSDEQRSLLERASLSNDRMIALVNDVLTLNHTDDSTINYKIELIDMVQLVDEVVFDFTSEGFKKGVEIVFIKPSERLSVSGDKLRLRVVMQNLLENAIKYSERGSRISIFLTPAGENVQLTVKDSGIGIPPDEQQNIFNKFFRASNAVKKESVGSGLGLYTTKRIIEVHKGTITFETEQGKGTSFMVTLPRAASASAPAQEGV
ncbi:MAG TPA: HAMP domain-containing sensor histidine kinase [Candidatus Paceibacterota bacterium]|nr:HAMP domain-containing sensor histidine kinase [Candidatus Paceibacterota bacterium]